MKTLTNRIGFFAAMAVVAGTLAYGQVPTVKANIPFAFRTSNAALPAGEYIITQNTANNGGYITVIRNTVSSKSVLALAGPRERSAAGPPVMTFLCSSESCVLVSIRALGGTVTYSHGRNKSVNKGELAIVNVPLVDWKGERGNRL